jgi:hypothetical protein
VTTGATRSGNTRGRCRSNRRAPVSVKTRLRPVLLAGAVAMDRLLPARYQG